ncbi:uncharacterized protein MONBRDRAFT_34320 [Monosiga brevicollis MX1]|uniref:WD repeat-containing protein 6 n=1 Tax=Monosiga brevicollis TaxID=81824 RepID=A9VAX6_MONBE|nr:uncharacterized protein MONBRDRAFT_34320 [Monosiga brevicollis MX1]EDQ85241.1 predicted protein [Monosiga brevicollis MX1]|eukprot:XP_001749862.1 hypothetical protein [Monosiga brevicollis MX1]
MAEPAVMCTGLAAPVTGVLLLGARLALAGKGQWVELWDRPSAQLLLRQQVMAIHDLHLLRRVSDPEAPTSQMEDAVQLLAVGGKELVALTLHLDGSTPRLSVVFRHTARDWIWDCHVCRDDTARIGTPCVLAVALALGHNQAELYHWHGSADDHAHEGQLKLVARAVGEVNCLLYAARYHGSHVRDLVLASGTIFRQTHLWYPFDGIEPQTDHTDTALPKEHVKSTVLVLDGHDGVIFNVRFDTDRRHLISLSDDRSARLYQLPADLSPHRPSAQSLPILTLYGHTARVWEAALLPHLIVTAGEDGVVNYWSWTGERLRRFQSHRGLGIWSLDTRGDQELVTGGGDGALTLHSTAPQDVQARIQDGAWTVPGLTAEDHPNQLAWLDGFVLVCSKQGHLITHQPEFERPQESNRPPSESALATRHCPQLARYAVMGVDPAGTFAVLAGLQGFVLVVGGADLTLWSETQVGTERLVFVQVLPDSLLVLGNARGHFVLARVQSGHVEVLAQFQHTDPRTAVQCCAIDGAQANLFLGDRQGYVHHYARPDVTHEAPHVADWNSCGKLCVHGRSSLTSIRVLPCTDDEGDEGDDEAEVAGPGSSGLQLMTSGRDGYCCRLNCRLAGPSTGALRLELASRFRLHRQVDWIAGLELDVDANVQYLHGFIKNEFVCLEAATGHLVHWQQTLAGSNTTQQLGTRFHGRVCNAVELIPHLGMAITGAEDLQLGVWRLGEHKNELQLASFVRETAVIRCLTHVQHPRVGTVVFVGCGDGRVKAWSVPGPDSRQWQLQSCWPSSYWLRYQAWQEARVMALEVLQTTNSSIDLVAGYSNGQLIGLRLDLETRRLHHLGRSLELPWCWLSTAVWASHSGRFMAANTRGQVALYDWASFLTQETDLSTIDSQAPAEAPGPMTVIDGVHQSGINAMAVIPAPVPEGARWLATCGDDNAVVVTELSWEADAVRAQTRLPRAHSAGATALAQAGSGLFISSGADCRVNLWRYHNGALVLVQAVVAAVHDVQAAAVHK